MNEVHQPNKFKTCIAKLKTRWQSVMTHSVWVIILSHVSVLIRSRIIPWASELDIELPLSIRFHTYAIFPHLRIYPSFIRSPINIHRTIVTHFNAWWLWRHHDVTFMFNLFKPPTQKKTNKKFKVSKNPKKRTKSFKKPSLDGTISIFQFHFFRRQRNF